MLRFDRFSWEDLSYKREVVMPQRILYFKVFHLGTYNKKYERVCDVPGQFPQYIDQTVAAIYDSR